jgi:hypothetical protein
MAFLTREKLLAKQKLEIEKVDLGGSDFVFVREMTGSERDAWEVSLLSEKEDDKKDLSDFRAKLVVHTACDEKGKFIFKSNDYKALSQNISGKRIKLIADAAGKINKVTIEDQDALVKNSEAAPSGNSTSGSVGN